MLMNPFHGIGNVFSCGCKRGLEHRIPYITAAHLVASRQCLKVNVLGERRRMMQLHAPYLLSFHLSGHFEHDVRPDASLKCGVEVCGEIGGKNNDAAIPLEFL